MLIQKERDDKLVSFIVICDKSFLLLFRKSEDGIAENLAALMRDNTLLLTQSQHLFVEEREVALADFVPMCQKIGGQPLGEDAYETSVSFEPCAKADFSLLAQTTIGTMEIKKRYPLSFECYVAEVFGVTDIWDPEAYLIKKAPYYELYPESWTVKKRSRRLR